MKLKPILLAGALVALPLGVLAQEKQEKTEKTTTTTMTNASGDTKIVTVTGTIQSYDAGHSITITNPEGEQVTYTINESSQVPKTLEVGKTVTVRTTTVSGSPIVKTITMTKTTNTTTKKKSY